MRKSKIWGWVKTQASRPIVVEIALTPVKGDKQMRQIKWLDDWRDAVDECGPWNLRRLHLLVFIAETRGWVEAASDLQRDLELLETMAACERDSGQGWSLCPPPPPCGFSWGIGLQVTDL